MTRNFLAALEEGLAKAKLSAQLVDDISLFTDEIDAAVRLQTSGKVRLDVTRDAPLTWTFQAACPSKQPETLFTVTGTDPTGYPAYLVVTRGPDLQAADGTAALAAQIEAVLSTRDTASRIRRLL
jgi:hypothetical protein